MHVSLQGLKQAGSHENERIPLTYDFNTHIPPNFNSFQTSELLSNNLQCTILT